MNSHEKTNCMEITIIFRKRMGPVVDQHYRSSDTLSWKVLHGRNRRDASSGKLELEVFNEKTSNVTK